MSSGRGWLTSRRAARSWSTPTRRSTARAGPRGGFVVGRSVGASVVRNRVTRRLRTPVRAAASTGSRPGPTSSCGPCRPPLRRPQARNSTQGSRFAGLRRALAKLGQRPRDTIRTSPSDISARTWPSRSASRVGHDPGTRSFPWSWSAGSAATSASSRRWPGPTCRYYPSCSAYALGAVRTHGPMKGSLLTIGRLVRCNPWSPGGIDHVPAKGLMARW